MSVTSMHRAATNKSEQYADKSFEYNFAVDKPNRITFEYSPEADERMRTDVQEGVPFLSLNRPAMITLARILIKMAYGDYTSGFHVHLPEDFNADLPECLTAVLAPGDARPYQP